MNLRGRERYEARIELEGKQRDESEEIRTTANSAENYIGRSKIWVDLV